MTNQEIIDKVRETIYARVCDIQSYTNDWFELGCGEEISDALHAISGAAHDLDQIKLPEVVTMEEFYQRTGAWCIANEGLHRYLDVIAATFPNGIIADKGGE